MLILGDFFALVLAFIGAYIARVTMDTRPLIEQIPSSEYIKIFLFLLPFWLLIFAGLGLYSKHVYENRLAELWRLGLGSLAGMLFIIGYDFVDDPSSTIFPARLVAVYGLLLGFALLVLIRQLLWQLKKLLYRYDIGVNHVMLIGSSGATKDLASLMSHTDTSGYKISVIVGAKTLLPPHFDGKHFSNFTDALKQLKRLDIDTIIQTKLYENPTLNQKIQRAAIDNHLDYRLVLTEHDFYGGRTNIELFHYFPMISVSPTPLLGWGRIVKRVMDFFVSLLLLIILSPVLLLVSLMILLFDFGPIFFKQKRLTRHGQQVPIIKFRTLKRRYSGHDALKVFAKMNRQDLIEEYTNHRSKVRNDPRVSWLGRILRTSSLDELPQLFNVLVGQISLVGPRTIPKDEAERDLREKSPLVLSVKTGITGLAQVSGRSDLSLKERIRLDQYYVQNWSVWLDIKILLKTLIVVFKKDGAQ